MKAYHVINPDSLSEVMDKGLLRTSRGDKGDDSLIIKADKFLDKHRPQHLRALKISRDNNLYAYAIDKGRVIDITNGSRVPLPYFLSKNNTTLELDIDPDKCFVSDLDVYDKMKSAIERHADVTELERRADEYWRSVVSIADTNPASRHRPEIMITYDVPADKIKPMS